MLKRFPDQGVDDRYTKRFRFFAPDRFSSLSDELILRALSYLSISQLVVCERCANFAFFAQKVADREDFLIV